ncbi:MAG: glycine cleavage system protein GcvH [Sandaracinaceae bacterium]|nr:glycine cleavage system protein GcvH [Sandaracinaceae bacterium]
MSDFPTDVKYTKEHEWARVEGDLVRVGVTRYAVDQLGDVTLVDLPSVGDSVTADERFGDIESVKTVSELFSPISGEIVEINPLVDEAPETVNEDPYGEGWFMLVRPSDPSQLDGLLDAAGYESFIKSIEG